MINLNISKSFAILLISLMVCIIFLVLIGSNSFGIPFFTGFEALLGLIIIFFILHFYHAYEFDNKISPSIIYSLAGVLVVLSLFPVLNYYAFSASEKKFHETVNFLGQKSWELSAHEITVFWGMWYMKVVYVALGALLGFLCKDH